MTFKMPKVRKINADNFQYVQEAGEPVLVMGMMVNNFQDPVPDQADLAPEYKWQTIVHQTAGHGCHQRYMVGIVLNAKDYVVEHMKKISNHFLDSEIGCIGTPCLDDILKYREMLRAMTMVVDCNYSYRDFEEGFYPINCSIHSLNALCKDKFPDDLEELLHWDESATGFDKIFGSVNRWSLVILGDNCD